jgi:HAD superfamily hydrolase (TIGR01490 family)
MTHETMTTTTPVLLNDLERHRFRGGGTLRIAVFDLDHTVIDSNSITLFARTLYNEGFISKRVAGYAIFKEAEFHLRKLLGLDVDPRELRAVAQRAIRGWDKEAVDKLVRERAEAILVPAINPRAEEAIKYELADKDLVIIMTASPKVLVRPLADYLHIPLVIGSTAQVDANGKYQDIDFYCYGEEKVFGLTLLARELGRRIDLGGSSAYGDSDSDFPLLKHFGQPHVINGSRRMQRVARTSGWDSVTWDESSSQSIAPKLMIAGGAIATGLTYVAASRRAVKNSGLAIGSVADGMVS